MEITYDRDYYSCQHEMFAWAREHIGPGGWKAGAEFYTDTGHWLWTVHAMFGYTTFVFVNDADGIKFKEYWNDRKDN